jgi:hypothetical protein
MSKELVTRMPIAEQPPVAYSFEQIQRMAVAFAKSQLFGVKDSDQALALMLYAQASGRHPALVMRDYDIIQNRLAKKSEAMLRDFQASGGRVEWTKYADDGVTGVFTHPLSIKPVTIDWDMDRAKKAGLSDKNGGMYSKFTRAMFRSRCISEGVRTCAPDATEQMYTPEEVRQISEENPAQSEPVSIQEAVTEAAAQVTNQMPLDEVEALIGTMDVKTIPELVSAFGKAYTVAKTAGDEEAKRRLKSVYDDMRTAIEVGSI